MKLSRLSVTRSKQLDLLGLGVLLLILIYAELPWQRPSWVVEPVVAVAVLAGAVIVAAALIPKENVDERAVQNAHKADSLVFNLLYMAAAFALIAPLFGADFTLTVSEVALVFVAVGFLRSAVFLLYERFGS